jgi:sugar transferase (PEP-CTERM/EpsH1 system associated)
MSRANDMDILYLAHRLPFPPNKGDRMRAYRHLEHLARSHDVRCASFVDTLEDMKHVAALRAICREVATVPLHRGSALARGALGLATGSTVTQSYYRHAAMTNALKRLSAARRFDVVLAFSSSMAPYALSVPANRRILDLCDCDSQKWLAYAEQTAAPMKWIYKAEGSRLQAMERRWARAFDATLLITQAEAATLRPFVDPECLHVVGNGGTPTSPDPSDQGRPGSTVQVGFVGVMNYRPNVDAVCWFVENCWREIRQAVPRASFHIVGRSPSRQVRALANTPGIRALGEVTDVAEHLRGFTVSIAPMRIACGLQNKVLEAMTAGLPVVLSQRAAQAVGGIDGRDFLVADAPDRFIRAVVRLLRSDQDAARIGESARSFVRENFRWEDQLSKLDEIVCGVSSSPSRAQSPCYPKVASLVPA